MNMKADEIINELILQEIPEFIDGKIISDIVLQTGKKARPIIPLPIITPIVVGLVSIPGKKKVNTVTYHYISTKDLPFDDIHLMVYGYQEKENKPFDVFKTQIGTVIPSNIEEPLAVRRVRTGFLKYQNRFAPIFLGNEDNEDDYEDLVFDLYNAKNLLNNSMQKLNSNPSLLKIINNFLSSKITINEILSTITISFKDDKAGLGCLVPSESSKQLYSIFQTVPNFSIGFPKPKQSLRLAYLINAIQLCAEGLKDNQVQGTKTDILEDSSASIMLNLLKNVYLIKSF